MISLTHWNWQQPDWPGFVFDPRRLAVRESAFMHQAGVIAGAVSHFGDDERLGLVIEVIGAEAVKSSEIEGELLDRDSVQASLRQQFGLLTDARRIPPAANGAAQMFVDLFRNFSQPLDEAMLCRWQAMLMAGRADLPAIGHYREGDEPMQIVSGAVHAPKVHFEAPPASRVAGEMRRFLQWYAATAPAGADPLPALARAGLAHLYFVSIHPFEDGNGRLSRAIAEKALAEATGQPTLTALARAIQQRRASYYDALEQANKSLEVDAWLDWFADTVLAAQRDTRALIDFTLDKTRLLYRVRGQLNARQEKALLRVLREGPEGFRGGLSAGNYANLTGAPAATARRDLADLVERGALVRTGERKGTRYWLAFNPAPGAAAP